MSLLSESGFYHLDNINGIEVDVLVDLRHPHVGKEQILHALSEAFEFPDYFGFNWDAAFDCLLDAIDAGGNRDILISLAADTTIDDDAMKMLRQLFSDVLNAQPEGKRLRIFCNSPLYERFGSD